MEPKNSKIFNKTLMQAVSAFCDANNIEDKDDFIYLCFKQGFDIKKFGFLGETLNEGEKDLKTDGIGEKRVEIEVIREIRVEVPVEVIKEVEKIVEVIKEVPVEKVVTKIEYISDKTGESELFGKIEQLEEEMSKKNNELDELRRNLDIILDKPPVEIEKIVEVDKSSDKLKMMSTTLQNLRNDLSLKNERITELEKINQELQKTANLQNATYMKGSNLNSRI
jgi:predicted RNase H-like nuclease (RuvC/YqgF family)